jgi:hypothetical protein
VAKQAAEKLGFWGRPGIYPRRKLKSSWALQAAEKVLGFCIFAFRWSNFSALWAYFSVLSLFPQAIWGL